MELSKMSEKELKLRRRELAIRRSSIDNILDRQAYGDMSDDEVNKLEEESERCLVEIMQIDKLLDQMLNNKKR